MLATPFQTLIGTVKSDAGTVDNAAVTPLFQTLIGTVKSGLFRNLDPAVRQSFQTLIGTVKRGGVVVPRSHLVVRFKPS